MPDAMLTHTAIQETAKRLGFEPSDARALLAALNVPMQAEPKPLPTEPGSAIIATEVRGGVGEWVMVRDDEGDWCSAERIRGHHWHRPEHITTWTEAVVVPAGELDALAGAQDTLEELAKMGVTETGRGAALETAARLAAHGITHHDVDRMVKQHYSTAQYAAPAEGKQIDSNDVRAGDRVHLVLDNGDEVTITVIEVSKDWLVAGPNAYFRHFIRSAYLIHREEV